MDVILQFIGSKWELIPPFARANNKTIEDNLKDGEKEFDVCQDIVHIVTWDGDPPKIVKLSAEEIEELKRDPIGFRDNKVLYREKCFLWIIDESSLKIAREKKRNVKRAHDPDFICHTNLTNGGKAYIGGEVLFGEDKINVALGAAGNWHLAVGRFLPGENRIFRTRLGTKNKGERFLSQLPKASIQPPLMN